jgi:hypothetical protein
MTPLANFLLVFVASSAGAAICGILGRTPDKRTRRVLAALAVAAVAALVLLSTFKPRPDCYHPAHVQAVWLDGAWQCITADQAG